MYIQQKIINYYRYSNSVPIVIALTIGTYIIVKIALAIFAKLFPSSQNTKFFDGIKSSRLQLNGLPTTSNGTHNLGTSSLGLPTNIQQILPPPSTKAVIEQTPSQTTHEIHEKARSQMQESQAEVRFKLKETRDNIQQTINSIKEIKLKARARIQEDPTMVARVELLMDMKISNLISDAKFKIQVVNISLVTHNSTVKSLQTMGVDTAPFLIQETELIQSEELMDPLKSLNPGN